MDKAVEEVLDGPDLEKAEAEYERFVWANLKRNYAAHYLHGMLGMTGFRLVNAPTFLPAYLSSLAGGSEAMVGLGLGLQQLGAMVSPIFGATHIEHRKKVLPVSMLLGTLMRVQILGMAVAGFLLSGVPLLTATLIFLFLLGLFMGPQRVAFQMLLAKVIPISRRGRLQAWRNVTGGLVAAVLSYLAGRYLIDQNVWGNGYAATFLAAFVLTSLGLTALRMLMIEPEPPTVRPKATVRERLKDFPALFAGDRNFLLFMLAQLFAVAGRVAAPFYILHASKTIELSGGNIGILSFAFLGADTLTNLAWGYIGDRFGFRATFIAALFLWIAATGVMMIATDVPMFFVAFMGLGAAFGGYMMSSSTMVLEFGLREDIAMRLALVTTVEGVIAALSPLVGGLIADHLGYPFLFGASIVVLLISLVLLIGFIKEPRKARMGTV